MRTEINLRTKEFAIAREFYWPRVIGLLLTLGLIAFLLVGSLLLYLSRVSLEMEIKSLVDSVQQREIQAAEADVLDAAIKSISLREELKEELAANFIPWTAHIKGLDRLSNLLTPNVTILRFTGAGDGSVTIEGASSLMRPDAAYILALEDQGLLTGVAYEYIMYERTNDHYSFKATAEVKRHE